MTSYGVSAQSWLSRVAVASLLQPVVARPRTSRHFKLIVGQRSNMSQQVNLPAQQGNAMKVWLSFYAALLLHLAAAVALCRSRA